MNWKELPLNSSKSYLTVSLVGGCDLFVPIKEAATIQDIDETRKELKNFAGWQRWVTTKGDSIA